MLPVGEVQRLALRNAVDDVEEHDVPELFQGRQMRQSAADLAGSDQSNFLARHGDLSAFFVKLVEKAMRQDPARPGEGSRVLSAERPKRSSQTFGGVEQESCEEVNGFSDSDVSSMA